MDYEKITDQLIQKVMDEFNLNKPYQEFLDSLVNFKNFEDVPYSAFQKYLDNEDSQ